MTDSTNPTLDAPATPDAPIDESGTPLQDVDGGRPWWLSNVEVVHPMRKPQPAEPHASE